ncbi:UNVERIFIED_CONTAM: U8-agatoxin-Ao1a [Trichonephila clavipes]
MNAICLRLTILRGFDFPVAFLTTFAMKSLLFATLAVLLFVHAMAAVAYPPPLDRNLSEDYNDNNLENFLGRADKRGACIRRGGGCDGKPNDCCANSSCRCNLWGTNCRCERAGLFQQWGK